MSYAEQQAKQMGKSVSQMVHDYNKSVEKRTGSAPGQGVNKPKKKKHHHSSNSYTAQQAKQAGITEEELLKRYNRVGILIGKDEQGNVITRRIDPQKAERMNREIRNYKEAKAQQEAQREEHFRAQQEFINKHPGMTAREFYENYNVNMHSDGSYTIAPKNNQQTIAQRPSYDQEMIKRLATQQAPIHQTTTMSAPNMTQYISHNLEPKPKIDAEKAMNVPFLKRIDLSVKNQEEVGLIGEYGVNMDTVDWAEKTIQDSNYGVQQSLRRDTTTELFANSKEANPTIYREKQTFDKANNQIQKFHNIQDAKTTGILVGTTALTVATGGVATAVAGELGAQGLMVAKGVGTAMQVGYGYSVGHRGYKLAKNYDKENPSKTFYGARNLFAEVGGVVIGAGVVQAMSKLNPDSYKVTHREVVVENEGTKHIAETGKIKNYFGKKYDVELSVDTTVHSLPLDKVESGTYAVRVLSPKGQVRYADAGVIEQSTFAWKNNGVLEFESGTSINTGKGAKHAFFTEGSSQRVGRYQINFYESTGNKRVFRANEINRVIFENKPVVQMRNSEGVYDVKMKLHSLYEGESTTITSRKTPKVSIWARTAYAKTTREYPFLSTGEATNFGETTTIPGTRTIPKTTPFSNEGQLITQTIPNKAIIAPVSLFSPTNNNNELFSPGRKTTSHYEEQAITINNPRTKTITKPVIETIEENKINEGVRTITEQSHKSRSKTSTEEGSIERTTELTETETEPTTDVITETITQPKEEPKFDFFGGMLLQEQPPIIPPFNWGKKQKKQLRNEYFDVEVRSKGRFLKANTIKLTREQALNFGTAIVDNTALASFRIVKNSKRKLSSRFADFNPLNTSGEYKKKKGQIKKKKGLFIEKKKYRISTPGELGEITYKGLATIKGGFKL